MNLNSFDRVSAPLFHRCAGIGLLLVLTFLVQPARGSVTNILSFTNSAPITINSSFQAASPYPSTNLVSVTSTNLVKVTVSLFGLTDPSTGGTGSADGGLDILLAGPVQTNPAVNLMYNAGLYNQPVSGLNLIIDDDASQMFSATSAVTNGTYQPSGVDSGLGLNPPQTASRLAGFIGTPQNGTWGLYIHYYDYFAPGSISGGWSLNLYYRVDLPSATTLAANPVGTTSATLNASVNPGGGATSVYFEWGPDTSYGNFTATNLLPSAISNQMVGIPLTGLQPNTTNHFQAVAFNAAGASFGGDLTVITPSAPPIPNPVPTQFATPEVTLLVTNSATDVNVPAPPLTFTLDASAPANAYISPNGLFAWTPTCQQGSTTNYITVWVSDNYTPAMSNAVVFPVIVGPCVQLAIGSSAAQTGTETCVPVSLYSTVALSNVSFSLSVPTGRFNTWGVSSNNSAIASAVVVSQSNPAQPQFNFATKPGQSLLGAISLGTICVDALPVGASIFAPFNVAALAALATSGNVQNAQYAEVYGIPGRVVLVGAQPLLEASLTTNLAPLITVYGTPNTNLTVIKFATNLMAPIQWNTLASFPQTNLAQFLSPGPATNKTEYFEAIH